MKNKRLILIVTLIAIAAMLLSGGTVMAADRWHGGHGSRGWHGGGHGGHGWHGDGFWRGGWGWPLFGLGVAAAAILSYPYYYQPYPYYPSYDPYGYAPAYRFSPRVIYREREYEPDQEYGSARDYEPTYDEQSVRMRPSATSANGSGTWYYCKQSNAYYPYVRQCAGGWEKVPAVPPPSGPEDDR